MGGYWYHIDMPHDSERLSVNYEFVRHVRQIGVGGREYHALISGQSPECSLYSTVVI